MLEQLFGSKTRHKLLRIFFRDPEQSFFVRELSRQMGIQINAVRRELELLLNLNIIKEKDEEKKKSSSEVGANLRKYYQLNSESIVREEIRALLIKDKILGEQQFVQDIKNRIGEVKLLLLTGNFTENDRAPTDLFVVGAIKERSLAKLIAEYEKTFGFEIRYTAMSVPEFTDRRYVMDKFVYSVFEAEHLKVVDEIGV